MDNKDDYEQYRKYTSEEEEKTNQELKEIVEGRPAIDRELSAKRERIRNLEEGINSSAGLLAFLPENDSMRELLVGFSKKIKVR